MSAVGRLLDRGASGGKIKVLAASGQLGYGILEPAFKAGIAREPDFIGADMGSIDQGPSFLGAGRMATAATTTRRDLELLLTAARGFDVPLIIGSAGTAGAAPHLEATLEIVRDIARELGLRFRLAVIRADVPKDAVKQALHRQRVRPIGAMAPLTEDDVDAATHLVGQMGTEAFARALETAPDVIIAGRSCDTAVFAAIPERLGFPMGLAMHMAKIIECASLCCSPGGRDAMLGVLEHDAFVLESMNPERHATPMSVAAHGLYEQADPFSVSEPEGRLRLEGAQFEALDNHRTRVRGASWEPAAQRSVKIEGAAWEGERAVLLAGSSDPRFIAAIDDILPAVEAVARELVPGDYRFYFRVYGRDGVTRWPTPPEVPPREVFVLVECLADTAEEAATAVRAFKQYLLHHGFPGRLSTAGNIAFPFTPAELDAGTAYRYNVFHIMETDDLAALFPVSVEEI